ncbi:MAG TPA: TlpA disulfide reductase family protein [Terriglobales bacterium]|nr:TlpA disulfide reductase family protein [Terriglobales bacterium]
MALASGVKAPEFALTSSKGKSLVLSDVLKRGPAVLSFFKVSCPVCQYAFPYLERLWQVHKSEPVTFIGISQDNAAETEAFVKKYGISFPVALDDPGRYIVSNAYKLTNVPTVYLVDRDGEIQVSSVGWARQDIEEINLKLSMMDHAQQQFPVFKPGEDVAAFKAG